MKLEPRNAPDIIRVYCDNHKRPQWVAYFADGQKHVGDGWPNIGDRTGPEKWRRAQVETPPGLRKLFYQSPDYAQFREMFTDRGQSFDAWFATRSLGDLYRIAQEGFPTVLRLDADDVPVTQGDGRQPARSVQFMACERCGERWQFRSEKLDRAFDEFAAAGVGKVSVQSLRRHM